MVTLEKMRLVQKLLGELASNRIEVQLLEIAQHRRHTFYDTTRFKAPPRHEFNEDERMTSSMGGTVPSAAVPGGIASTAVTDVLQKENNDDIGDVKEFTFKFAYNTLQQNNILHAMKSNWVEKCIAMYTEIAKDNHEVDEQFGKCIKFGENRVRVNQLFDDEIVSFEEYVNDCKKEGLKCILCVTDESMAGVESAIQHVKAEFGQLKNEPSDLKEREAIAWLQVKSGDVQMAGGRCESWFEALGRTGLQHSGFCWLRNWHRATRLARCSCWGWFRQGGCLVGFEDLRLWLTKCHIQCLSHEAMLH